MIHFEGTREFARPPAEVAAKLADAAFLVGCLKVDAVVEVAADRAAWRLRPPFSFVSGTLETTLDVVERSPERARYRLVTRGIGATATVDAAMHFAPAEGGTRVEWTGDLVELTGLLKLVPKGLVTSSAGKVIEEVWQSIEAKLNA
jgi:carbon monoxide dehydrogenase subunit G